MEMGYFLKGKGKKGKGKKGARGGVGSGAGRGGKVAEEVGVARDWGAGLPPELLEAVARRVAPEDRFCFRLVCRGWAEAGGSREGGGGGKQGGWQALPAWLRTRSTPRAAAASEARVEWARSCVSDGEWERYMWPRLCNGAAGRGDLEMLKWLRAKGCPWDKWTCANAAKGGHLEMLKWLRAEGCPWDEGACAWAALRGHLEVLKWLQAEGCPWDESDS